MCIIFFIEYFNALNGFFSQYTTSGIHNIVKKDNTSVDKYVIPYHIVINIICSVGRSLISCINSSLDNKTFIVDSKFVSIVPTYLLTISVIINNIAI